MTDTTPVQFVCVLRTGGPVYDHRYVNNLYRNIKTNIKVPFTLTCLTDSAVGIDPAVRIAPLKYKWSGWWSKIEIFAPNLFPDGRVWYMDLDTIIIRDLTTTVTTNLGTTFAALSDFYAPERLASGVMTWFVNSHEASQIYLQFTQRSDRIITSCSTLGDQCWIGLNIAKPVYLQQAFPGAFVSLKKHCVGMPPIGAQVVCFHGSPRPHEIQQVPQYRWAQQYWQ